jgi:DNA-binding LytR/AlgR family response regulator
MKVLIIEDEQPAVDKLKRYLCDYDSEIIILSVTDSVNKTVEWFENTNNKPDLIFMDIQLNDGICFEIFKKIQIEAPVIFTTAFDQYAIEAFKNNGIDYLLKPISFEDFWKSMKKINQLKSNFSYKNNQHIIKTLEGQLSTSESICKNRFLVKSGEKIRSIEVHQIALFYAEGRDVFLYTNEPRKYIIDFKLENLENLLDLKLFMRVNRTFIVNINFIKEVIVYSNNRLKINLSVNFDQEIIVSREKVKSVKEWMEGN